MITTATFEHGEQKWCVQVVELGPQPVLFYCESEGRAKQLSEAINKGQRVSVGTSFLANGHNYEDRSKEQRNIAILGADPTV